MTDWIEMARSCDCHRVFYRRVNGKIETKRVAA